MEIPPRLCCGLSDWTFRPASFGFLEMDGRIRSHVAVASEVTANVLVASGHLMN